MKFRFVKDNCGPNAYRVPVPWGIEEFLAKGIAAREATERVISGTLGDVDSARFEEGWAY